jgi:hypothetical protein
MRAWKTIALVVVACAALASAQDASKPGTEVKKLDYFVGTWSVVGEIKPSPFGPGGKLSGTDHLEWMEGGFFLVGHSEGNNPTGLVKGLSVWGYDGESRVYTFHEFNNEGEAVTATGTVDGDSWTWMDENKAGGKVIRGRYSMKQLSPTVYTFKFEMQPEGGEWSTVLEGRATKK